jgi:hypothetical protein
MRSYCAVYVDAGYLLASSATRVTGSSFRAGVRVDHAALIAGLVEQAERVSGLPLLRVNWYDSGPLPGGLPNATQEAIGMLPGVKLRLGRLSPSGEQKGVDLRIGLDLATHGRNRVVDQVFLVSGDDDLTEAVEEAQGHGVQVLVLAVPNVSNGPHAVSRHLQREADGVLLIDSAVIDAAVRPATEPSPSATTRAASAVDKATAAPAPLTSAVADGALTHRPSAQAPPSSHEPIRGPQLPSDNGLPSKPISPSAGLAAADGADRKGDGAAAPTPADLAGYASRHASHIADSIDQRALEALLDQVAAGVVDAWSTSAGDGDHAQLLARRPYIPRELDKALLVDLSTRLGLYDVDETVRYAVRDRFWGLIELGARTRDPATAAAD